MVGNAHFCKECLDIWYLSDIQTSWEDSDINNCTFCSEEVGHIDDIMYNLKSVLIKMGFETTEDKDEYLAGEMEDLTNVQDVYDELEQYVELIDFDDICFQCFCDKRIMKKCGENYNFLSDINSKCCAETLCEEHFGDGKYVCTAKDCEETIHMCESCYTCEENINCCPWDGYTSVCMHCHDVYCKDHMRGKYCVDCSWRHGRDYS